MRRVFLTGLIVGLIGYAGTAWLWREGHISENELDDFVPLVQTPSSQIARVRTTWWQNRQVQTTFLDRRGRVLEQFSFGILNSKVLNRYDGPLLTSSVVYQHGDSDALGYGSTYRVAYSYDAAGRLRQERCQYRSSAQYQWVVNYRYGWQGDTSVTVSDYLHRGVSYAGQDGKRRIREERKPQPSQPMDMGLYQTKYGFGQYQGPTYAPDQVRFREEVFQPEAHLPLQIPRRLSL